MNYTDFVKEVKNRARLATLDEAEETTCATMNVLGQRIPQDEAVRIAGMIPDQLSECLKQIPNSEQFDIGEFYRRVGEREGIDSEIAADYARIVCSVLKDAIGPTEIEDILSDLPYEYDELFGMDRQGVSRRRAA